MSLGATIGVNAIVLTDPTIRSRGTTNGLYWPWLAHPALAPTATIPARIQPKPNDVRMFAPRTLDHRFIPIQWWETWGAGIKQ